jgi:hypothetical protein
MANKTNLATIISLIVFAVLCVKASVAQTSFYIDPAFTGGTRTGSQSQPWHSLSDSGAWSAINSALAGGNVTVFFSATGSSTNAVGLGSRTDSSTHVLTLDGISQKNTNSNTPSWVANVTPQPCKFDAPGCEWASAPKFTVTATTPFAGTDSAGNCNGFFTIQGFTIHNTEGQTADLTYIHDLIFQYNDASRTGTGSYGPGIIAGPGNGGPGCGGSGPRNVTIQYNRIHATWGECLYIGASTPDPPGNGNASTGDNYLIQGNVVESCASWGAQGDGMDIKDGHTNLRVLNNTVRPSKACTSCGSNGPGSDGQGIVFESASLIDGNYVEAPGHNCIVGGEAWNNTIGRGALRVSNNIAVNCHSGVGQNNGIAFFSPTSTGVWSSVGLYNNSIFNTLDNCISIQSGQNAGSFTVENNTCQQTGGGVSGGSALATHNFNDYFNAGVTCPVSGEANSVCVNPQFVSTATPYVDTNFKLQSTSPVALAGFNLSSLFSKDYFGNIRTVPWAMSASVAGGSSTSSAPNPPTGLVATVN